MKVLILSCNTGQGHNTAGKAVQTEFHRLGIECEMMDALSFGPTLSSRLISGIHSKGVMHLPTVYGFGVSTAKRLDKISKKHSVCYVANTTYASALYEYITENGFDVIVNPHVFPSEAITRIRRKHGPTFRTYFISTDYCYPPFLSDTDLDVYFIPHASLAYQFVEAGLDESSLVPCGIPTAEIFATNTDRTEARRALGLPEEGNALLVMTGSMGYGNTEELVDELLRRIPADTWIMVMGGNNEKMKNTLRRRYKGDPRLFVIDYTTEVSLYMDAANILFTKPGGLSSTEAAVKGIPTIHTRPIPGWEEENISFFGKTGMSLYGANREDLVTHALYLLANPWACEEMVEAQRRTVNRFAARDICRYILDDANHS